MKYAILIPLGGGDEPRDGAEGTTPLAVATLPNLGQLARSGRVARVQTIEGAAVSVTSGLIGLLDGDPNAGTARRVSDASIAALGAAGDHAWVYSLGWLATTDASGGPSASDTAIVAEWDESTLTSEESDALWNAIAAAWAEQEPALARTITIERHAGRWVLIDGEHDHDGVTSLPPWRLIGEPWRSAEPGGGDVQAAWVLRRFMHVGSGVLASHDINVSRMERGLPLITIPWPWGSGRTPLWPTFASRFGKASGEPRPEQRSESRSELRGEMVTDDPLSARVGRAIGWTVREVAPGRVDQLGELAVDALGRCDLVCVCDAGALGASLAGDAAAKVRALERFDAAVVGPVKARLDDFGDPETDADARGWRLLALPDAIWPTGALEPATDPVPAILAGAWIRSVVGRPFTEAGAEDSDLRITSPSGLMEFFLEGGLVRAKAVRKRKDEVGTLWELET